MIISELTQQKIDERVQQRISLATKTHTEYRYVRPFSVAYNGIIDALAEDGTRFRSGLGQIDMLTRGFGAKELIYITGFSHSGKTQLVNTMILNNPRKRILFFSMDDPAEMILMKLVCMQQGYSAEYLEQQIRDNATQAKASLREAAHNIFEHLLVVDDSLSLTAMDHAVDEATHYWNGQPPELVILDYLGLLLPCDMTRHNNEMTAKSQGIKGWIKNKPFPTVVVHQGTRSNARPGEPLTMLSMAYGGEQEGTCILGIRRKRDNIESEQWERDQHADTVTIHLIKNKRPPARCSHPEGIDFFMESETGLIRALHNSDLPTYAEAKALDPAYTTTEQALAHVRQLEGVEWKQL